MNDTTDDPVKKYLKQLDAELADLPRGRRREIVDEIADHIAEARAGLPAPETESDIRTLLERLGDPADIPLRRASASGCLFPGQAGWSRRRLSSSSSAASLAALAG